MAKQHPKTISPAALVALLLCACGPVESPPVSTQRSALQQTLSLAADTGVTNSTVDADAPNGNTGASVRIGVGHVRNTDFIARSLARFVLPATLQNRATITRVQLRFGVAATPTGPEASNFLLHKVAESWVEGTGNAIMGPKGALCTDGATWNTTDCTTNWQSAGGTTTGGASGLVAVPNVDTPEFIWDSNAAGNTQMETDVQGWLDSPATNFGWRIASDDEGLTVTIRLLSTRESGDPPVVTLDYDCKAGFAASGSACTSCNSAANTACAAAQSGNSCNDPGAPATTFSCTCGHAAYTAGPGGTSCVNLDECVGNPCDNGGDATATCSDRAAPLTGYTCNCSAGWNSNGVTCVDTNECGSGNPCGQGTCTNLAGGGGYTCACNAGYTSTGGATPVCVNFNACSGAALTACVTGQTGNVCVDGAPPSTGYSCTCGHAAYVAGGGGTSCVNRDECSGNPCDTGGDGLATCTDRPAPQSGFDCTCSSGWTFSGGTCSDLNECLAAPCGAGTCVNITGGQGYSCTCPAGYVTTGGGTPTCVDLDGCTPLAQTRCASSRMGNLCVDDAAPSLGYHCQCGNASSVLSGDGQRCENRDSCNTNPCSAVDTRATCTAIESAPNGYRCSCSLGFSDNGTTCVDIDECQLSACGSNGECTNTAGAYECRCPSGFTSTGFPPTCTPTGGTPSNIHVEYSGYGCEVGSSANDRPAWLLLVACLFGWMLRRSRYCKRTKPE